MSICLPKETKKEGGRSKERKKLPVFINQKVNKYNIVSYQNAFHNFIQSKSLELGGNISFFFVRPCCRCRWALLVQEQLLHNGLSLGRSCSISNVWLM